MIFWIAVIIFAVGIFILIANAIGEFLSYKYEYSSISGCAVVLGASASILGGLSVLILGLVLAMSLIIASATKQANTEKYKALTSRST